MRRWIPNYAKKAQALNDLLAKECNKRKVNPKDITEHWGDAQDASFRALKQALKTYPVLRQFDPNKPVTIITDASDYAKARGNDRRPLGAHCREEYLEGSARCRHGDKHH